MNTILPEIIFVFFAFDKVFVRVLVKEKHKRKKCKHHILILNCVHFSCKLLREHILKPKSFPLFFFPEYRVTRVTPPGKILMQFVVKVFPDL
jgi:hypothetical protein